jgi:oligopeptidase B
VLRFKDLRTGQLLPDRIENAEADFALANDNKTVFYVDKDRQTLLGKRVMRHVLGTPVSADVAVFVNDDDTFYLGVGKSRSERYVVMVLQSTVSTETRMLDADHPAGNFQVLIPRERDHEYQVEDFGDEFIVRTNWQAPNFRLIRVKASEIADRSRWQEIVPHRADAFIENFVTFKDCLAVEERSGGLSKVRVLSWDGKRDNYVTADEAAYTMALGTNEAPAATSLRYTYTSPATPASTFELDLATGQKTLLKRQPVLGGYDPKDYVVEYRMATARDGVQVPVSLVYRKGTKLDGTAPLYQYAYGSYGASTDPTFSLSRLPLLDRGFVYAIAHIRGGQEMGRQWYEDGRLLHKRNTFTDFIDVTRFLVAEHYGHAGKVFAMGGSAGGLLMAAVANLAPLDYRGIVAHVPFVDVVTTMLDESIPLTTNEWDEWGDPKEKAAYDYMLSYSPYDNVERKAYPALLVTTGLWDSQVQYFEPAKWVAKLRAMKTDTHPLLLHVNMEAGHGGKSGRFQRFHEVAMEYAWVLQQLAAPTPTP